MIETPFPPEPHNPTFASPKGYKIQLRNGVPDPMQCCWLWLVDQNGDAETMFEQTVPAKSVDAGKTVINGVAAEHWHWEGKFPFLQIDDFYFTPNGSLVQANSYASVFSKGTIIGNSSYTNWDTAAISNTTFAVPTSDPTFGQCKQCGVDPECDMQMCTSG